MYPEEITMIQSIVKFLPLGAVIVAFSSAWSVTNHQVQDHERRIKVAEENRGRIIRIEERVQVIFIDQKEVQHDIKRILEKVK